MDLQRLRTFRSVVTTGSVRGAAEALGYAPASVSEQVARLQREAGVALLTRVGRGVEPTAAGRALAARLDPLLGEADDVERFLAALPRGPHNGLELAYFSSLGAAWMPGILARLAVAFPDARVGLHVRDEVDAGARPVPDIQLVAEARPGAPTSEYLRIPLALDPYVAAVPADDPLAQRPAISLRDLRERRWVDINSGRGSCRQILMDACSAAGFRPDLRVQAQDYPTTLALVAAGLGIAVLPRIGALDVPPGVEVVSMTLAPKRYIAALVRRERAEEPLVRHTVGLIREAAAG